MRCPGADPGFEEEGGGGGGVTCNFRVINFATHPF